MQASVIVLHGRLIKEFDQRNSVTLTINTPFLIYELRVYYICEYFLIRWLGSTADGNFTHYLL